MDELTESARQCLVSQGIIWGGFSIIVSLGLTIIGILVTTKNDDILHFIALYQLAILEIACGMSSLIVVVYVWWIIAGYRNRQIIVRSKYLDEKMSRGLVILILPILLCFAAFIVSGIFLMIKTETTSSYEIRSAMLSYPTDYSRKIIIDKLQTTFKCCGSQGVEDWFSVDWQNSASNKKCKRPCRNTTRSLALEINWDSVPFSCCALESPPPCIHNRLQIFGTDSVYANGCAEKLDDAVFVFVLLAVIMFFLSTFLMVPGFEKGILLYSGRKLQTSARSAICKGDATAPGCWWLLTPPGDICGRNSMTDSTLLPLLVRRSGNLQTSLKCENSHAECDNIKNIITSPALITKKMNPYRSNDEESSDEWSGRPCEVSRSTSNSSLMMTEANATHLASRQSVSDSAVPRVDANQRYKACSLFRS